MKIEGYFKFYPIPESKSEVLVEITNEGLHAFFSNVFIIKNRRIFWTSFMNVGITLANIAVAITAIWALTKDNDALPKLEGRMKQLETELHTKQVEANPRILHLQNVGPTNNKDSLKK